MLNGGKFTNYQRSGLWAEAANTAMLLKNNLITPNRTLSPFQQFFGKETKNVLALMQKFGEMCITTFKDNTHRANLANCGTPGIRVGYAQNHPASTYWIFNPKTKKIILTRDVTFLQKSYGEYTKVEKPTVLTMIYEGLDDKEELETVPIESNNNNINVVSDSDSDSSDQDFESIEENFFDDDIDDQVKASPETTVSTKVVQATKKLFVQ